MTIPSLDECKRAKEAGTQHELLRKFYQAGLSEEELQKRLPEIVEALFYTPKDEQKSLGFFGKVIQFFKSIVDKVKRFLKGGST
jgi:hypothetical protein